ncbi:MAG TPA: UGSC family (seleno)protein [Allosphingosinicella sp.]|nr:UGSC family (seleno)protein [Allosphingosinicella sp.]
MEPADAHALTRANGHMTVMSPVGSPPAIVGKRLAPRLASLEGRTIYLVDSRFDDSIELLRQVQAWFAEHHPLTHVRLVSLNGYYGRDDPELWAEIRAEGDAAILGVGHCSTCAPAVATHAVTLETKFGVPTVTLHTSKFDKVVRSVLRMAGLPGVPTVFVPQPVMGRSPAELRAYVDGEDPVAGGLVMQHVLEGLTGSPGEATGSSGGQARATPRHVSAASEEELHDLFLSRNWTDKLPIVLPTEERVAAMLAGTRRGRHEMVGSMQATLNRGAWDYDVEKVAVNAVMAGARPEYFPVILALAASGFTARSSSSSSGACMVVVNGPVRAEIGMNAGVGAMGPYNHANATIGRAYGLLSQNLQGGSVPGESYMGSLGNGHSYTNVTFAENEERSPWEPLHVRHGFAPDDSAVSIFFGLRSTSFSLGLREKYWREHVRDMLAGVDLVAAPTLLLDPIAARQFVERGDFRSKEQLVDFIHETATMPAGRYWDLQLVQNYIYPEATRGEPSLASRLEAGEDEPIRTFLKEAINVVVVGGETNGYWQIMGASHIATVGIDAWR